MPISIFLKGEFLDIYPYMDWIFVVNHDGEILIARTEELVDYQPLHDFMFRQSRLGAAEYRTDIIEIELQWSKFKKIGQVADKFSFADIKFFYSNIICGSNDGLEFLPFDTQSQKIVQGEKITDTPIASISAKYMTVFASSLETGVTTLFGVEEGKFATSSQDGPETTRVGISDQDIFYYMGRNDVQRAHYTREASRPSKISATENDREQISEIDEIVPYPMRYPSPDFVFNSRDGVYFKIARELIYFKHSTATEHVFPLDIEGKLIRAHLFGGAKCFEFLDGLYLSTRDEMHQLLRGECITSRGYANSPNYKNLLSAVNDDGAFLFKF